MILKFKNNRLLIIILASILIAIGAVAFWLINDENDVQDTSSQPEESINFGPPTDEELAENEQNKEEISNEQNSQNNGSTSAPDSKKTVVPVLTYWGQSSSGADFELNGYIPEVIESDGTCTATLTRSTQRVSQSKTALPDAQNTSCGLITIAKSKLSNGEWTLVLSYDSSKSSGSSESVKVTIK